MICYLTRLWGGLQLLYCHVHVCWTCLPCNGSARVLASKTTIHESLTLLSCPAISHYLCYHYLCQNNMCGRFVYLRTGVLHTSVVLLTEMCERSPDMLSHFRKVWIHTRYTTWPPGEVMPHVSWLSSLHISFSDAHVWPLSPAKINQLVL